MTPEQFQAKIEAKFRSLNNAKLVYAAATHALDSLRQRLYIKGISGGGAQTGKYSTEPFYASKKQFKKGGSFSARGKTGKGKKKNGQERKTMYLPNGYKELRQIQGYESNFVNIQYTGDLFTDTSKLTIEKDSVTAKISRLLNQKKVKWLSDKYGKDTFKHTKKEREEFAINVQKELIKYLSK